MPDFDALNLKIRADIRDMANKLSTGAGKVRKFSDSSGKHAKAVGRSFAEMGSRISGGLKTAGQGMTSAGRSIGIAGAAITGSIGLMARSFSTFEDGLKNIEILLGGDKEAMAAIEAQIRSMAVETGVSRDIMTKAFFDVQSATGDVTKAMGLFEASVKLAEAGGGELEASTSGLLTLMENYGDALGGAADGADLLFKAQEMARATVGELAQTSGMYIPIANKMGVSAEDAFAAFAKMSLGLGDVNQSATSMAGVLNALDGPTKEMIDQMKAWGYESSQRAVADGKFLEIMKKLGTVEAERLKTLIPNIRAGKGLAVITNDYNGVLKMSIDLKTRAGIVDKNFLLQQQKLSTQMGRMKQSWLDLSDAMIAPLVPMIKELAGDTIPEMTKGIKVWIADNKDLAASIAKTVGVVGVGGVGLGGMLFVTGQLALSLISLGTAIKWVSLTALPALWTAVTAVGTALYGLAAASPLVVAGTVSLGAALVATTALVIGGAYALYKLTEAIYEYIKATNNAAKAERQRAGQYKENTNRLVDANNEFIKALQGVSEEDKKRIELLNQKIEKENKLRQETEARIKTGDMDLAQGKKLRDMSEDHLVQYAKESMALENELKAKYKAIEADKEKTKEVELSTKSQDLLNKKIEKSVMGAEEYAKVQELLKERLKNNLETQDTYTQKMEEAFQMTQRQTDATNKQTDALRDHTSAIGQETAAIEKQYRVLVSRPGEGSAGGFIPSTPLTSAATPVRTAAETVHGLTGSSSFPVGLRVADSSSGLGSVTSGWPTGLGTLQRGTPFVPQTGMYQLHKGEAVTPRGKNEGETGEITIVNVIDPSMVNGLLDKNLIINTLNADIIKRGVTRRVIKGVSR